MDTDESKVAQILRNLISNALKFTERGEIRVSARAVDVDDVCFEVLDTGIGIAPEHHQRVFEEFSQISGRLQSGVKGTGLGLALVRRLATLLGGTVGLESELGKGTRFSVRLPRRLPQAGTEASLASGEAQVELRDQAPASAWLETAPAPEPAVIARSPGPLQALIVDDDAAARHILGHLLRELGCEVTEARDGAQGLWLARKSPPEVIFLDLEMPALSGWEVLPQLHSEPRTRRIPVVLYTGRPQAEQERTRLGVQGLLRKRGDSSRLRRELHEVLAQLGLPTGEAQARHV
jgi:CheY-like chemotaxis protein